MENDWKTIRSTPAKCPYLMGQAKYEIQNPNDHNIIKWEKRV
jgi:hypothetical protein